MPGGVKNILSDKGCAVSDASSGRPACGPEVQHLSHHVIDPLTGRIHGDGIRRRDKRRMRSTPVSRIAIPKVLQKTV